MATTTDTCCCCGLPIVSESVRVADRSRVVQWGVWGPRVVELAARPLGQGEFCTCPNLGWCEGCGACCDHCKCEETAETLQQELF